MDTNDDPGILCFQHSENEPKVFCFKLPHSCQFCDADLLSTELQLPPFRIPYPFKSSTKEYNTVVIKPTVGNFLSNYENSSDLHIGVTDSTGYVIEYDINGLKRSKTQNWEQCLSIKILPNMSPHLQHYWDEILYETFIENCWTPERYNAENHNCYSFVLAFLKSLELTELEPYLTNKVIFCEHFVTPQTRIAANYISLFRQLKKDFCLNVPSNPKVS